MIGKIFNILSLIANLWNGFKAALAGITKAKQIANQSEADTLDNQIAKAKTDAERAELVRKLNQHNPLP